MKTTTELAKTIQAIEVAAWDKAAKLYLTLNTEDKAKVDAVLAKNEFATNGFTRAMKRNEAK